MKIMLFSTSTNNTNTVIDSLKFVLDPTRPQMAAHPDLEVFRFDAAWNSTVSQMVAGNPQLQAQLQAGQLRFQGEAAKRVKMDREALAAARDFAPDVILGILAHEGDWMLSDETMAELNTIAPAIHILFDATDPPWRIAQPPFGNIHRYHANKCFDLTVAIDGGREWPGDEFYNGPDKIPGMTKLTPLDPRYFLGGHDMAFNERPYPVGYAANAGGWIRGALVERLKAHYASKAMFGLRLRDDQPGSYRQYADFLRHCRVMINVPFTGSGAAKHVKGRVIESGYAGCALMEWKNEATRHWVTPRYEMLEYESVEELLDLSEWLAGHPKVGAEMAAALQRRMLTEHNPVKFWGDVFERVGKPLGSMPIKEPFSPPDHPPAFAMTPIPIPAPEPTGAPGDSPVTVDEVATAAIIDAAPVIGAPVPAASAGEVAA